MAAISHGELPTTSFFGFRRQGIHRWLFVAWRTKMLVLAMQFSRNEGLTRAAGPLEEKAGFTLAEGAVAPSQRNRDVSLHRSARIPRELNLRSGDLTMPTNQ